MELKPVQHPKFTADDEIISYQVPPKALTPYFKVPDLALVENDEVFQDSPPGSRGVDVCILGAPNAGKSTLMNTIIGNGVSAVSDKYNTTDDTIKGIYTSFDSRTQIVMMDTPGVTKTSNSMRSNLLVTKAWNEIPSQDLAIFMVDSVKRLSMDIKAAIVRLNNTRVDPTDKKVTDAIRDGSFSQDKFDRGDYFMTEEEKQLQSFVIPSILIMNKVDLVTSKRRLKSL